MEKFTFKYKNGKFVLKESYDSLKIFEAEEADKETDKEGGAGSANAPKSFAELLQSYGLNKEEMTEVVDRIIRWGVNVPTEQGKLSIKFLPTLKQQIDAVKDDGKGDEDTGGKKPLALPAGKPGGGGALAIRPNDTREVEIITGEEDLPENIVKYVNQQISKITLYTNRQELDADLNKYSQETGQPTFNNKQSVDSWIEKFIQWAKSKPKQVTGKATNALGSGGQDKPNAGTSPTAQPPAGGSAKPLSGRPAVPQLPSSAGPSSTGTQASSGQNSPSIQQIDSKKLRSLMDNIVRRMAGTKTKISRQDASTLVLAMIEYFGEQSASQKEAVNRSNLSSVIKKFLASYENGMYSKNTDLLDVLTDEMNKWPELEKIVADKSMRYQEPRKADGKVDFGAKDRFQGGAEQSLRASVRNPPQLPEDKNITSYIEQAYKTRNKKVTFTVKEKEDIFRRYSELMSSGAIPAGTTTHEIARNIVKYLQENPVKSSVGEEQVDGHAVNVALYNLYGKQKQNVSEQYIRPRQPKILVRHPSLAGWRAR